MCTLIGMGGVAGSTWTEGYGWSGRQYVYVPRTVRVTVTYVDTLTEG